MTILATEISSEAAALAFLSDDPLLTSQATEYAETVKNSPELERLYGELITQIKNCLIYTNTYIILRYGRDS